MEDVEISAEIGNKAFVPPLALNYSNNFKRTSDGRLQKPPSSFGNRSREAIAFSINGVSVAASKVTYRKRGNSLDSSLLAATSFPQKLQLKRPTTPNVYITQKSKSQPNVKHDIKSEGSFNSRKSFSLGERSLSLDKSSLKLKHENLVFQKDTFSSRSKSHEQHASNNYYLSTSRSTSSLTSKHIGMERLELS